MTNTNLTDLDREALIEHQLAGYQKMPLDLMRLWPHVFAELATGQPVDPARVAARAEWPIDRTLAVLKYGEWDRGDWDPARQRLVGLGLTSIETRHRVFLDGVTLWAWCALDALWIPSMIGKAAHIESPCVATGDPIRIHVTPTGVVEHVDPPQAVTSNVSASLIMTTETRQSTCGVTSFYRDAEAATGWLAATPNGRVLPVANMAELYREVFRRLHAWLAQQPD